MGKLDDVCGAGRGGVLQRRGDSRVQPGASRRPTPCVQALVDERMPEPETPAGLGCCDQARGDRGLQVEQQVLSIEASHAFEHRRLDVPASHCGEGEQRLGVAREPTPLNAAAMTSAASVSLRAVMS